MQYHIRDEIAARSPHALHHPAMILHLDFPGGTGQCGLPKKKPLK